MALISDTRTLSGRRPPKLHPLDALTLLWIAGGCALALMLIWVV
jgi:hypothetical protein